MNNKEQLKYVKHGNIDYEKWDRCIKEAPNSRIYAISWHLDRTALVWDALIWGDYEFVMPLPLRKKFGINYSYQPLYCQQLGIFPAPPAKTALSFYNSVIRKFRYSDIQLNSANQPPEELSGSLFIPRKNYLLRLSTEYDAISSGYSKNTHRNIAKANNNRLAFVEGISLEEYLDFKQKNLPVKLPETGFQKLKSLIAYSQHKEFGEIIGVYSSGNNLCAAVFFCRWKGRLIYMNALSSNEGKELRAMFFLIDQYIQMNAEKELTLDFEGSTLPGIARFFSGFSATPETYYRMKHNRLPVPFRWIKKMKA